MPPKETTGFVVVGQICQIEKREYIIKTVDKCFGNCKIGCNCKMQSNISKKHIIYSVKYLLSIETLQYVFTTGFLDMAFACC